MSRDAELELYRGFRAVQDRYVYFLLAAAGASIAFSVTQTQDDVIGAAHLPLAVAVVLWGLSFYLGCRRVTTIGSSLYANSNLLKVEGGRHPEVGNHPEMQLIASQGIRKAIETISAKAHLFGVWQFRTLIAGAVFFIIWHTLEMYMRVPQVAVTPG